MIQKVEGVVHGKSINVAGDLNLRDGERVELTIEKVTGRTEPWGEGLRRCAGALADFWTEEDERILERIHRERHHDPRPEVL